MAMFRATFCVVVDTFFHNLVQEWVQCKVIVTT